MNKDVNSSLLLLGYVSPSCVISWRLCSLLADINLWLLLHTRRVLFCQHDGLSQEAQAHCLCIGPRKSIRVHSFRSTSIILNYKMPSMGIATIINACLIAIKTHSDVIKSHITGDLSLFPTSRSDGITLWVRFYGLSWIKGNRLVVILRMNRWFWPL